MTRKTAFGLLALLAAAAVLAVASPAKPNFSGTYVLDLQKSKLQIGGKMKVLSGEIVIGHAEPAFKLSRAFRVEGKAEPLTSAYEATTDGRAAVTKSGNATSTITLAWDGDALVFTDKTERPRRTTRTTVRYRLEDGGKTLVAEESFRGPKWKYDNVWVAVRK